MARAALNWTVRDLAEATGLHRNTVTNIEVGRYAGNDELLSSIEKVFRAAGVEFFGENGVSSGPPGEREDGAIPPSLTSAPNDGPASSNPGLG